MQYCPDRTSQTEPIGGFLSDSVSMNDQFLKRGKIPSLDGWRALSVLFVLMAHSRIAGESTTLYYYFGVTGVRFFFVISGFLITWLLLREEGAKGRISLGSFYLRRAFRILPVYYVFLTVAFVCERLVLPTQNTSISQWLAGLTFTANYSEARGITGHLWTLSVEEQFYLLWPLVFILIRSHRSRVIILSSIIIAAPVFRTLGYILAKDSIQPFIFHRFSFLLHNDILSWGCLSAVILWHRPNLWRTIRGAGLFLPLAGLLLITSPLLINSVSGTNVISIPFTATFQAVGFTSVMLSSIVLSERHPFSSLNWPILIWFGTISYSLYLWHMLFTPETLSPYGWIPETYPARFIWVVPAILCAVISYYSLEKTFMAIRKRYATHD